MAKYTLGSSVVFTVERKMYSYDVASERYLAISDDGAACYPIFSAFRFIHPHFTL